MTINTKQEKDKQMKKFNWKPEEQALTKENSKNYNSHIYEIETQLSTEEKCEYLCEHNKDFEYILNLGDKFKAEKVFKRNNNYYSNYISWLKKNDTRNLINYAGAFFLYDDSYYIEDICRLKDLRNDFIDKIFHKELIKLRTEEYYYFLEHDEYSKLEHKLKNEGIIPVDGLGNTIRFTANGVYVFSPFNSDDAIYDVPSRKATLEELMELNEINDKLRAYLDQLKEECNIKY